MFIIKCVKCIICKVTYNMTIWQYSVAKVDYRGAAAPKIPLASNLSLWSII